MTPGTRVAIERPPCATVEHVVADKLTGRTGTVIDYRTPWVTVVLDGPARTRGVFRHDELQVLTVDGADP